MKDLIPVSQADSGLQLMEPMANTPAPANSKFRPQKLLHFLLKFWWIPMITASLTTGYAVYKFFHTPPTFVSYGSMWEAEKLSLPDGASFSQDRDSYVDTLTQILRSRMMWNLTTNYMMAFKKDQIVYDQDGNIIPVDIEVYASTKGSVYNITAISANPAFTPAYLNALMEQYKEYRSNVRDDVSVHTVSAISEQVGMYERDLKLAQTALTEYERSNNFAGLQEESTLASGYLVKLKTELSDYQLQLKLLDAGQLEGDSNQGATNMSDTLYDSLRGSGGTPTGFAASRMDAGQQIEVLKLQRAKLAKNLRPNHPKMVKLDEDIAKAQKLIEVYKRENTEQITTARQALQIKIDNVNQFIAEWEAKVTDARDRLAKADNLKQEVASKQRMYDRLSALNDNVQVGQHIGQDTLNVLDQASPSTRSYTEAKSMLMQSIMMGLALGAGIIFLLALRDDRFGSLVEVTEKFGDNVVGQVPDMPTTSGTKLALIEGNDERHMFAESYRNLRSALLFLAVEGQRPKVMLITSAVPDEGKSTVATNLARTMAMGGSKVLLIDGDLRRGRIHSVLNMQAQPGLTELLNELVNEQAGPEKFIQNTSLQNLDFISRGAIPRNPGDLFLSPAFDRMVARLRDKYDYILIDTCPVFAADDTSTIAPRVDGTLFVVRNRFSHSRMVRQALDLLFQRQARVLGLIFNRADASSRSHYFYKYAQYYSSNVVEVDADSQPH